jgi:hypothetical protein
MKGTHVFFYPFRIFWPKSTLHSSIATYLAVERNIEYQHTDSGILDTQIVWLLLSLFLMIDERHSCTFFILFRHFGHKLHYIKVLKPAYLAAGNTKYQHTDSGSPDTQIISILKFCIYVHDKLSSGIRAFLKAQQARPWFVSRSLFLLDILTPIERWAELRMYLFRAGR